MECKIMFQNNLIRAENDAIFHNDTQPIDLKLDRPLVRSDEKPPVKFQGDNFTYTRDASWDLKVIQNGVKPFTDEIVKKSCFHVDL